ncbi:hypothetical protein G8C41_03755 [Apibacter sp. B3706]|nr:hypothetical protein [Apibacter sp. B3706]QII69965.1 hypothetical protein G8C41_03755 [Apibacter sp. B3706]
MKGEITHKEKKQARKKAIENLKKAKEIEAEKIEAGKKYYRRDKRTIALR